MRNYGPVMRVGSYQKQKFKKIRKNLFYRYPISNTTIETIKVYYDHDLGGAHVIALVHYDNYKNTDKELFSLKNFIRLINILEQIEK